jgi:beta-phosphoglucomutase-like phosphatase (HAD superfamily)
MSLNPVKGKPDPEIYLKTAQRLTLNPKQCVVFEDSPPGVEAAKRAGMIVVGILTTHSPESLSKVDILIRDYSELLFAPAPFNSIQSH